MINETIEVEGIARFSLKILFLSIIGIILFSLYLNALIFGENSLTVLNHLEEKEKILKEEKKLLKADNQRLQKTFFELKQLLPKEGI
jgi:hypothetical protein